MLQLRTRGQGQDSKGRHRKEICMCGYRKASHSEEAVKHEEFLGETWDPKRHVSEEPTDAYRDITFSGSGQNVGKFVRVSSDTKPDTLYKLMRDHWGLNVPNLLISVTGGAKNFHMKPRLKSMFRRGLIKVSRSTAPQQSAHRSVELKVLRSHDQANCLFTPGSLTVDVSKLWDAKVPVSFASLTHRRIRANEIHSEDRTRTCI
ncbi:UNVERIFIED_CONTAM: hypothetical protein FKN15_038030 [Acipenser sinensis]